MLLFKGTRSGDSARGCVAWALRALLPLAILTTVILTTAACTNESWSSQPYVWPAPVYGEAPPQTFRVRYSELRNSEEDVRALIAGMCVPGTAVARVWPSTYTGSALHPQELHVVCGSPPASVSAHRGLDVPESRLIPLIAPASPPSSP